MGTEIGSHFIFRYFRAKPNNMKYRIAAGLFAGLLFSCSPKTVVQPTTPEPAQTPTTGTVSSSSANIQNGKTLYENNCAKCHRLYAPNEETAENWEPILKRMQKKARLEDADMAPIHDYIFANLQK